MISAALGLAEMTTARPEITSVRPLVRQRDLARNCHQPLGTLIDVGQRNAADQPARVRVARLGENFGDRPFLDDLAGVHDRNPIADLRDQAKVVGDEQQRGLVLGTQRSNQLDDARFDGDVEARRGLVEQQQRGPPQQRHRDDDTLLLSAGKLVRIGGHDALDIGQPDVAQRCRSLGARGGPVRCTMEHRDLRQLVADDHRRIERRHRLLVDHADTATADAAQLRLGQGGDIATAEPYRPADHAAVAGEIAKDRVGRRGLAAARFADKPQATRLRATSTKAR